MGMNDETWERHANPLSVYSRFSCLPLIVAAIWSRVWLGWWALAPLALAIGWTFINPRLFPAPIDKATGAAKAVMGERFFFGARKALAVPERHVAMAYWLTALSFAGAIALASGRHRVSAGGARRSRDDRGQLSSSTASRKASIRPSGALMTCSGAGKVPPCTSVTYSLKAAIRSCWIACIIL